MKLFFQSEKLQRIKAFSIRKETRGFIHEECFNTHIRKSVLQFWSLIPTADCKSVALICRVVGNQVRFLQAPPNLQCGGRVAQCSGLQIRKTVGSNPTRTSKFPLVVKWYNNRLITGHYKFDSCREDQVQDSNSKLKNSTFNGKKMLSCFIHCRRLVARTLPFQGGEAGSIPVDSTNICSDAGNWKTGNVENVVTQEVWVRVPLRVPNYTAVVLWEGNGLSIRLRRVRFSSAVPVLGY